MKKKIIFIACTILVIAISILSLNEYRQTEYQKYCKVSCEDKRVSSKELEEVKYNRRIEAESNIIEYDENISNLYTRLSNYDLNDDEKKRLENADVKTKYDENNDYELDELIKVEKEYQGVNEELENLLHDYSENRKKQVIADYTSEINEYKTSLEAKTLNISEKNDLEEINKRFQKLEYDKAKDYPLGDLEEIVKEINSIKKEYKKLDNNVN